MNRFKNLNANLKFVFISPTDYESSLGYEGSNLGKLPFVLNYIAQNNSNVLYLNLNGAAGPVAGLRSNGYLLPNDVHETATGAVYFGQTLHQLLVNAAS